MCKFCASRGKTKGVESLADCIKVCFRAPGDSCPIPVGAKWDQPHIPLIRVSHCLEPIYFVFI